MHAVTPGGAGVRLLRAHYLYRSSAEAPAERLSPPYAPVLRGFLSGAAAVPASAGPAFVTGYSHVIPTIDMALYLPWLEAAVTAAGGELQWGMPLQRLSDAYDAADPPHVLVNCAALGAAQLADDAALTPVRGIKIYVRAPSVNAVYSAEPRDASPDFTTVIPRALGGVVACSGVAQPGATSLQVTQAEVDAVLARCTALVPALRGAPVVGTWAGLRPLRAAAAGGVRLEAEAAAVPDAPAVVHCYGHGGAGVITSWGCAADVTRLAAQAAETRGVTLRRRELPQLAAGLPPLLD
jgi:D-amino-acid oxidase